MIVALDACTIIYLVEGGSSLGDVGRARLRELLRDPAALALCSRLARLECGVVPLRVGDVALLGSYDAFFRRRRVRVVDVNAAIIERATELRARYRFRRPTPFTSPPRSRRMPICSSPGTPICGAAPR